MNAGKSAVRENSDGEQNIDFFSRRSVVSSKNQGEKAIHFTLRQQERERDKGSKIKSERESERQK